MERPLSGAPGYSDISTLTGHLDQHLRILLFDSAPGVGPIIFSSKFCNHLALKSSDGKQTWIDPSNPLVATERIAGTYHSKFMTTLGSREVTLTIFSDGINNHSARFRVGKSNQENTVPIRLDGTILLFDCTSSDYDNIIRASFAKKWPNHVLLYNPRNGSILWRVGWAEYTFKPVHPPNPAQVIDSLEIQHNIRFIDWYCAQHERFSYIRMGIERESAYIRFAYRKSYSLPWSHRTAEFEASKHGAVYWFDHTMPDVSEIIGILAGGGDVEFVHLMENPDRSRFFFSITNAPVLVFSKC